MTTIDLTGLRILVVEDETLIAVMVEDALHDLGCVVVGPVGGLDAAIRLARTEPLDAAILDVTIRGGYVFPVADMLQARSIPFMLASGYGGWALPANLVDRLLLTKPFTMLELEEQLRLLMASKSVLPSLPHLDSVSECAHSGSMTGAPSGSSSTHTSTP